MVSRIKCLSIIYMGIFNLCFGKNNCNVRAIRQILQESKISKKNGTVTIQINSGSLCKKENRWVYVVARRL